MKKYKLKLDIYELKIIINSLNEFRNKLIRENENTDIIDELLIKYIEILDYQMLVLFLYMPSINDG